MKTDCIWPEVFTNPDYQPTDKATACADGLTGWANCYAGTPIPENFGKGMAKIAKLLGTRVTPDKLMKYKV